MKRSAFWGVTLIVVFVRIFTSQPKYSEGDHIQISSQVRSEPVRYEYSQGFRIEGLWVYLPLFPEVDYGDEVVIEGIVNEGQLKEADLVSIKESEDQLYKTRQKIIKVYQKSLPSPHDSLVSGMTLGSKALLPRDFWEKLKATGVAHVVVASGMNVTLVANFLINTFILFIPRRKAVGGALVGIWIYTILAGFDAPIIRAAVMGSVGFAGIVLGKLKIAWRAFFLSAVGMLLVKPEWVYDLGFVLSFVATASLMLFERRVRRALERIRIPKIIREDLSTSLAAQIGVSPILFHTFGYFNILSPFINMLILWTVVPITVIGGVGGVVGLIFPGLARLILLTVYPLTWCFVQIVELFG